MCLSRSFDTWSTPAKLFVVFLILVGSSFMAAPLMALADTERNKPEADTGPRTQITTAVAKTADWALSISAQGEVLPWEVAIISGKTTGISDTEINVVEGDSVRKGQVLARFDNRLLRAELAQAKANHALAAANYQLATGNLKRADQLKLKQTLSEQEYDRVATEAATSAATRDQAAAAVTLAEIRLADATVLAPDDGKILERNIESGQVPPAGDPLFRMLRQHKLEWVAQIDATDLARIKPGMIAQVNTADNKSISGKVRSVSPQLTSTSRLARVRVLLDGAPTLAVNTYAEGKILIGNSAAVIAPADCVVIRDGKTWVFRVKNNTVEQVSVNVGRRQQQEIEIKSGVTAGDVLALEGAGFLNDGDKINVKNPQANGVRK